MDKKILQTHDKIFRETWENKENARDLLQNYLPESILSLVDFDTLSICKDSFIGKELEDYFSDILYKVNYLDIPGYVYILFEHKSWPEKWIHLQLLEYMTKIWRLDIKQSKSSLLPVIVPLVFYHGKRKWKLDSHFSSIISGQVEQFKDYIPDYKYIIHDLSKYTDEEIKGTVISRVIMLLFKHIFDQDIAKKLPGIISLLKEISEQETGLQYLETLLRYILSTLDNISPEEMRDIVAKALSEDKGDLVMTVAERLHNEGYHKGIQQGIQQGLELAVIIKFGDTPETQIVISKIKQIDDIAILNDLKQQLLSVKSIQEFIKNVF